MKIEKITVENMKAIEYQTADFHGCTAIVMGGNNQGKTTLLRALYDRIVSKGMNGVLRQGEGSGSSEYVFTDGSSLKREINAKGTEKFIYTDIDGTVKKTGIIKEIASKIFGIGFDIDKFLSLQPKEQSKKLEEILGIDLSDINGKYDIAYQQRAEVKRDIKQYEKFLYKKEVADLIDITDLRLKIEQDQKENSEAEEFNRNLDVRKIEIEREVERYMDRETEIDNLIAQLTKEKEQIGTTVGNLNIEYATNLQTDRKEIIPIDLSVLEEATIKNDALRDDLDHNEKVEKRAAMQKVIDELELICSNLTKQKEEALAAANLPNGFAFTDDGLYYNGFPLDKKSLSTSAIYIASLKLSSLAKGELDTQFFDASYLDKQSIEEVLQRAKENGDLQLLIERPLYEGGGITYELIDEENKPTKEDEIQSDKNMKEKYEVVEEKGNLTSEEEEKFIQDEIIASAVTPANDEEEELGDLF